MGSGGNREHKFMDLVIRFLKEDLGMDEQPNSWILMTDQHKGLENAIQMELPEAEH
ncbi:hypothetical protein LIER_41460 [Lithospermum erythrorhizon]|uniref:Transposase n=1 Tax=Lithospermum erythrorhizon TaxID=34254 RepID=A0AAV3R9M8_LITER